MIVSATYGRFIESTSQLCGNKKAEKDFLITRVFIRRLQCIIITKNPTIHFSPLLTQWAASECGLGALNDTLIDKSNREKLGDNEHYYTHTHGAWKV